MSSAWVTICIISGGIGFLSLLALLAASLCRVAKDADEAIHELIVRRRLRRLEASWGLPAREPERTLR